MKYEAVVQEYLPVNHHPPHYPIYKEYLDFLLEVIDELEIYFMYVHLEEMVYAKLCVKTKIYTPNCSFNGWLSSIKSHAAAAKQTYFPKGYREWCVDAKQLQNILFIRRVRDATIIEVCECIRSAFTRLFNFA